MGGVLYLQRFDFAKGLLYRQLLPVIIESRGRIGRLISEIQKQQL